MLPDRVSNPGPLTYESGALPIALCGPAVQRYRKSYCQPGVGIHMDVVVKEEYLIGKLSGEVSGMGRSCLYQ